LNKKGEFEFPAQVYVGSPIFAHNRIRNGFDYILFRVIKQIGFYNLPCLKRNLINFISEGNRLANGSSSNREPSSGSTNHLLYGDIFEIFDVSNKYLVFFIIKIQNNKPF